MTPVKTADVQLGLLFERYLTRLEARGRKPSTVLNFTRAAVPFQHWLNCRGIEPEDVRVEHLEEYFSPATNPYAQGTRRLHAHQLQACYTMALRRHPDDLRNGDPFLDFLAPSKAPANLETISSKELSEIKSRIRTWKEDVLFNLLVYTGLRKDEIRRLSWEDINWADATATFSGKGGKVRTVPLRDEVRDALAKAQDGTGIERAPEERAGPVLWARRRSGEIGTHYAERGEAFTRLLKPLTDRTFHPFRKSLATSLARNGVQQVMVETILGWSSPSMFGSHYFSPNVTDLHHAILKAYKDQPIRD